MLTYIEKALTWLTTLVWTYGEDDYLYYSVGYAVDFYDDYVLWMQMTDQGVLDSLMVYFSKQYYITGESYEVDIDLYKKAFTYQLSIGHADPYGLEKRAEFFRSIDLNHILGYLMKKKSIISLDLNDRDETLYGRIILLDDKGLALSLVDKENLEDLEKKYFSFDEILCLNLASGETLAMKALIYGLDIKDQQDFIEGHK